jgi:hypothetical protein
VGEEKKVDPTAIKASLLEPCTIDDLTIRENLIEW